MYSRVLCRGTVFSRAAVVVHDDAEVECALLGGCTPKAIAEPMNDSSKQKISKLFMVNNERLSTCVILCVCVRQGLPTELRNDADDDVVPIE